MKYGPITHKRMLDQVLHLRSEEKLSAPQIAKRLGTTVGWVAYQLNKFDMNERISIVGSQDNLAKAAEMRARGVRWKLIAKALGVDRWESLARAHYVSNR